MSILRFRDLIPNNGGLVFCDLFTLESFYKGESLKFSGLRSIFLFALTPQIL